VTTPPMPISANAEKPYTPCRFFNRVRNAIEPLNGRQAALTSRRLRRGAR
jgi:hypothetical protein